MKRNLLAFKIRKMILDMDTMDLIVQEESKFERERKNSWTAMTKSLQTFK